MFQEKIKSLGWELAKEGLEKTFSFSDFQSALSFINKVGEFSEAEAHHPKITNLYNQVTLCLWTHDAEVVTEKDVSWILKFEKEY